MNDSVPQVLRLQKKHAPDPEAPPDISIGQGLVDVQSVRNAITAGLIVIILFSILWALLSLALNRVFPWMTLLLGVFTGFVVRRAGLGLDWRFPLTAGVLAALGSLFANVVVAAALTSGGLGSVLTLISQLDGAAWRGFLFSVMTPADAVFAMFAAAIAAFFSMRRLSRRQYLAYRLWQQRED